MSGRDSLRALEREVCSCRACPRLVRWREAVAREKRASFRDWTYWGRPVPGFGDPRARLLIVGLAPAAHGGNRTGRVFTGDESGRFLYAALHRTGWARSASWESRDDGQELLGARIAAAVRCAPPANKPTPAEADRCRPFLAREIRLLEGLRAILCLGAFAWREVVVALESEGLAPGRPRPRFGHGAEHRLERGGRPLWLLGCYHPSQRNTFTGTLTPAMLDAELQRARALTTR